jgi:hypothetical protein
MDRPFPALIVRDEALRLTRTLPGGRLIARGTLHLMGTRRPERAVTRGYGIPDQIRLLAL